MKLFSEKIETQIKKLSKKILKIKRKDDFEKVLNLYNKSVLLYNNLILKKEIELKTTYFKHLMLLIFECNLYSKIGQNHKIFALANEIEKYRSVLEDKKYKDIIGKEIKKLLDNVNMSGNISEDSSHSIEKLRSFVL